MAKGLRVRLRATALLLAMMGATAGGAPDGGPGENPDRAEAAVLYGAVPDIPIRTGTGEGLRLADLWRDRPLLISLFYRRCSGTCSPFLHSLKEAVDTAGGLGKRYGLVSISFDPRDTADDVRNMAMGLGVADHPDWTFAVAQPADVENLNRAIGFWYRSAQSADQFDHPSLVVAVRDGRIVRVLRENIVDHARLKEVLWELRGSFVPFYANQDNVIFRCFAFDPETNTLRPQWGLLLLVAPGGLALAATGILFRGRRRVHAA